MPIEKEQDLSSLIAGTGSNVKPYNNELTDDNGIIGANADAFTTEVNKGAAYGLKTISNMFKGTEYGDKAQKESDKLYTKAYETERRNYKHGGISTFPGSAAGFVSSTIFKPSRALQMVSETVVDGAGAFLGPVGIVAAQGINSYLSSIVDVEESNRYEASVGSPHQTTFGEAFKGELHMRSAFMGLGFLGKAAIKTRLKYKNLKDTRKNNIDEGSKMLNKDEIPASQNPEESFIPQNLTSKTSDKEKIKMISELNKDLKSEKVTPEQYKVVIAKLKKERNRSKEKETMVNQKFYSDIRNIRIQHAFSQRTNNMFNFHLEINDDLIKQFGFNKDEMKRIGNLKYIETIFEKEMMKDPVHYASYNLNKHLSKYKETETLKGENVTYNHDKMDDIKDFLKKQDVELVSQEANKLSAERDLEVKNGLEEFTKKAKLSNTPQQSQDGFVPKTKLSTPVSSSENGGFVPKKELSKPELPKSDDGFVPKEKPTIIDKKAKISEMAKNQNDNFIPKEELSQPVKTEDNSGFVPKTKLSEPVFPEDESGFVAKPGGAINLMDISKTLKPFKEKAKEEVAESLPQEDDGFVSKGEPINIASLKSLKDQLGVKTDTPDEEFILKEKEPVEVISIEEDKDDDGVALQWEDNGDAIPRNLKNLIITAKNVYKFTDLVGAEFIQRYLAALRNKSEKYLSNEIQNLTDQFYRSVEISRLNNIHVMNEKRAEFNKYNDMIRDNKVPNNQRKEIAIFMKRYRNIVGIANGKTPIEMYEKYLINRNALAFTMLGKERLNKILNEAYDENISYIEAYKDILPKIDKKATDEIKVKTITKEITVNVVKKIKEKKEDEKVEKEKRKEDKDYDKKAKQTPEETEEEQIKVEEKKKEEAKEIEKQAEEIVEKEEPKEEVKQEPKERSNIKYPFLKKIISGGQTGADQGGLEAAKELGLKTGGHAPKGFYTEKGNDSSLGSKYGLIEDTEKGYVNRTKKNMVNSDATIVFSSDLNSAGTKKTIQLANQYNKPILIINTFKGAEEKIKSFLEGVKPETLNIAGNRESKSKGLQKAVKKSLVDFLKTEEPIEETTKEPIEEAVNETKKEKKKEIEKIANSLTNINESIEDILKPSYAENIGSYLKDMESEELKDIFRNHRERKRENKEIKKIAKEVKKKIKKGLTSEEVETTSKIIKELHDREKANTREMINAYEKFKSLEELLGKEEEKVILNKKVEEETETKSPEYVEKLADEHLENSNIKAVENFVEAAIVDENKEIKETVSNIIEKHVEDDVKEKTKVKMQELVENEKVNEVVNNQKNTNEFIDNLKNSEELNADTPIKKPKLVIRKKPDIYAPKTKREILRDIADEIENKLIEDILHSSDKQLKKAYKSGRIIDSEYIIKEIANMVDKLKKEGKQLTDKELSSRIHEEMDKMDFLHIDHKTIEILVKNVNVDTFFNNLKKDAISIRQVSSFDYRLRAAFDSLNLENIINTKIHFESLGTKFISDIVEIQTPTNDEPIMVMSKTGEVNEVQAGNVDGEFFLLTDEGELISLDDAEADVVSTIIDEALAPEGISFTEAVEQKYQREAKSIAAKEIRQKVLENHTNLTKKINDYNYEWSISKDKNKGPAISYIQNKLRRDVNKVFKNLFKINEKISDNKGLTKQEILDLYKSYDNVRSILTEDEYTAAEQIINKLRTKGEKHLKKGTRPQIADINKEIISNRLKRYKKILDKEVLDRYNTMTGSTFADDLDLDERNHRKDIQLAKKKKLDTITPLIIKTHNYLGVNHFNKAKQKTNQLFKILFSKMGKDTNVLVNLHKVAVKFDAVYRKDFNSLLVDLVDRDKDVLVGLQSRFDELIKNNKNPMEDMEFSELLFSKYANEIQDFDNTYEKELVKQKQFKAIRNLGIKFKLEPRQIINIVNGFIDSGVHHLTNEFLDIIRLDLDNRIIIKDDIETIIGVFRHEIQNKAKDGTIDIENLKIIEDKLNDMDFDFLMSGLDKKIMQNLYQEFSIKGKGRQVISNGALNSHENSILTKNKLVKKKLKEIAEELEAIDFVMKSNGITLDVFHDEPALKIRDVLKTITGQDEFENIPKEFIEKLTEMVDANETLNNYQKELSQLSFNEEYKKSRVVMKMNDDGTMELSVDHFGRGATEKYIKFLKDKKESNFTKNIKDFEGQKNKANRTNFSVTLDSNRKVLEDKKNRIRDAIHKIDKDFDFIDMDDNLWKIAETLLEADDDMGMIRLVESYLNNLEAKEPESNGPKEYYEYDEESGKSNRVVNGNLLDLNKERLMLTDAKEFSDPNMDKLKYKVLLLKTLKDLYNGHYDNAVRESKAKIKDSINKFGKIVGAILKDVNCD